MSDRPDGIACRRCETVFPVADGSCPECGTPVRGRLGAAVVVVVGLGILSLALSPFDLVLAVSGVVIVAIGVRAHRDRRRRMQSPPGRRRSTR